MAKDNKPIFQPRDSSCLKTDCDMFKRLIEAGIDVKSQQIDESDLNETEKLKCLHSAFEKSRISFLIRYGKYLNLSDLKHFDDTGTNSDLSYYVTKLKESINTKEKNPTRIKNRRYNYLQKILKNSSYFSEEEMKFRNPLLYRQYIEHYKTEEEILDENEKNLSQNTLSQFLFGTMDRKMHEFRCNLQTNTLEEQEEEEELDEDDESSKDEKQEFENCNVPITEDEKERLRKEFLSLMEEQFINGDDDYDYFKIDNDDRYDDICDQDLEDKYFDESDGSDDLSRNMNSNDMEYDY